MFDCFSGLLWYLLLEKVPVFVRERYKSDLMGMADMYPAHCTPCAFTPTDDKQKLPCAFPLLHPPPTPTPRSWIDTPAQQWKHIVHTVISVISNKRMLQQGMAVDKFCKDYSKLNPNSTLCYYCSVSAPKFVFTLRGQCSMTEL